MWICLCCREIVEPVNVTFDDYHTVCQQKVFDFEWLKNLICEISQSTNEKVIESFSKKLIEGISKKDLPPDFEKTLIKKIKDIVA